MNFYILLADLVAVVHTAFVAFVVIGFALIIAGLVMRREWSRAFWLRVAHLVAIAFVCAEAVMGVVCPLTTLESRLRAFGGETATPAISSATGWIGSSSTTFRRGSSCLHMLLSALRW
jgi:uncharacterized protein DUF2784